MSERLNKYLASHTGLSRRQADDLIAVGKISVDGTTAVLGGRVEAGQTVTIDGQPVAERSAATYLMLNKPAGYVSSRRRQGDIPTLYELLPPEYQMLKTAGRLDKDSSGLILLTNDGDFAQAMTHPKYHKSKQYNIELNTPLEPLHQQMIADIGIQLEDGRSQLQLERLNDTRTKWTVIMSEGRNRQIRRTFGVVGYDIIRLHRTRFGTYQLDDLASGEYRLINP